MAVTYYCLFSIPDAARVVLMNRGDKELSASATPKRRAANRIVTATTVMFPVSAAMSTVQWTYMEPEDLQ